MKAEIWTKPNCPYCVKAKNLFNMKGVDYDEVLIGFDETNLPTLSENQKISTREELLERVPNAKTVPQIWLDDNYIGGYNELASFWNIN